MNVDTVITLLHVQVVVNMDIKLKNVDMNITASLATVTITE